MLTFTGRILISVSTLQVGYWCIRAVIFNFIVSQGVACVENQCLFIQCFRNLVIVDRNAHTGVIDLESADTSVVCIGYESNSLEIFMEEILGLNPPIITQHQVKPFFSPCIWQSYFQFFVR